MAKNFLSSDSLLPTLYAASLSFSRLFANKCNAGLLDQSQIKAYGNVEECLREGVQSARKETSVYSIYLAFARGCLRRAYTHEGAVLGLLAYECALSFKGKQTLGGKDWGEGFLRAYQVAKSIYDGPILKQEESILQEAYQQKIDNLDALIALFSKARNAKPGSEVFYDFLKAQAIGFASPLPLPQASPFGEISSTRLEQEGYDLAFLLQLLNAKQKEFDAKEFLSFLEAHSIHCSLSQKDTQIKIIAHTKEPALIIDKAQEYGEFVSFSLKNSYMAQKDASPRFRQNTRPSSKGRAVVTLAPTEKAASLFLDLGASLVIENEQGQDIAIEHLLQAFQSIACRDVIFLPTSEKLYLLGKIASRLLVDKNVIVLHCPSLPQAYFALSSALFEEEGIESLLESLNLGIERIEAYESKQGELASSLPCLEEAEFCFLMYGEQNEEEALSAKSYLEATYPYLEVGALEVGLEHPAYLIGVSK